MSDTPSSPKSANLARIRDNQRRSRARRKEYVQELEAKYRECEAKGVQASAEMQVAARRVVDENRQIREENMRLKALLNQLGVNEVDLQQHLTVGASTEAYSPSFETSVTDAAESLEKMLMSRMDVKTGEVVKAEDSSTTSSPPPLNPTINIAAPTPSPIGRSPRRPARVLETQNLFAATGRAPALLSPSIQSLTSSSVSTPSTYEMADEYPPLCSAESLGPPTQTAGQAYMAQMYGYQASPGPSSWPPRSTYVGADLEAGMSSISTSLPASTIQTLSNCGPNIAYAQAIPTQTESGGMHLSGVPESKPATTAADEIDYALLQSRYDAGRSQVQDQNRWQLNSGLALGSGYGVRMP